MSIDVHSAMVLFSHLAELKGMKAAVIHSGQRALVAGAFAFAGGLVAGPAGIAAGGALGGILGAWMTAGQFRPVPQILMELPPSEQRKLYREAMVVLGSLDCTDAAVLISLIMGNANLQQRLTKVLKNYFFRELNAKIKCSR